MTRTVFVNQQDYVVEAAWSRRNGDLAGRDEPPLRRARATTPPRAAEFGARGGRRGNPPAGWDWQAGGVRRGGTGRGGCGRRRLRADGGRRRVTRAAVRRAGSPGRQASRVSGPPRVRHDTQRAAQALCGEGRPIPRQLSRMRPECAVARALDGRP